MWDSIKWLAGVQTPGTHCSPDTHWPGLLIEEGSVGHGQACSQGALLIRVVLTL